MKTKENKGPFAYSLLVLSANKSPVGSNASILAVNPNDGEQTTFLDIDGYTPDGIGVDHENKRIYWTHMGKLTGGETSNDNDGTIYCVNFDGSGQHAVVPAGKTFTPKQLTLDIPRGFIYWSDREGMRVMRSDFDGRNITVLVQAGEGEEDRKDATNHCVGVAIDVAAGYLYWTQKGPAKGGKGRIFRAGLSIPRGQTASNRKDIELLFENLPEPIDLEIEAVQGYLYWTDRGAAPKGNTLNRAKLETIGREAYEILADGYQEIIGLTIVPDLSAVFTSDIGGNIRKFDLHTNHDTLVFKGPRMLTGISIF
ncbi:MAG: hypothetical protein K0R59_229 [Sphingobacterium sp.]|jgi:hypothetical protein|nr:hypothetical protein [Sphingobacterium sp.]